MFWIKALLTYLLTYFRFHWTSILIHLIIFVLSFTNESLSHVKLCQNCSTTLDRYFVINADEYTVEENKFAWTATWFKNSIPVDRQSGTGLFNSVSKTSLNVVASKDGYIGDYTVRVHLPLCKKHRISPLSLPLVLSGCVTPRGMTQNWKHLFSREML